MAAPRLATDPPTAAAYEQMAATETAAGYAAWNEGRIKTAVSRWLSAARWSQYARAAKDGAPLMAAFPHSHSTGRYTVDQLEGEHCALCGYWFGLCPWPRPVPHELVDGDQTYRHVECPERRAK